MYTDTTWVVVANSSHAKIYQITKFPKIEHLQTFEHPESRLHDQDLVTSRPGRNFDRGGTSRHAYQTSLRPKLEEAAKFATSIAHLLHKAVQSGECTRIYLFASPSFLGMINEHLNKETEQKIIAKSPKDLTEHTNADIEKAIADL